MSEQIGKKMEGLPYNQDLIDRYSNELARRKKKNPRTPLEHQYGD